MCGSSAPMLYSPDQMNPATASTAMTDSPTRMSSVLRFTNAMVVFSLEPNTYARDETGVLDFLELSAPILSGPAVSALPTSEKHTSVLQSLMRISYAGSRLQKKTQNDTKYNRNTLNY